MSLSRSAITVIFAARADLGRARGALEPAMAFLLLDGLGALRAALALATAQERAVHRPQDRAVLGVDRDHRMQIKTAAALRAHDRRVLNRQHVAPGATRPRARARSLDHLLGRHRLAAQEPGQAHLSLSRPPESPNPNRPPRRLDETRQQKGPPFSRRRSPNRPSDKSHISNPSAESTRWNQSCDPGARGDV